jgi:hypothetical protein
VDLSSGHSEDEVGTFFIPVDEASGKRQRVTFTDMEKMGSDHNRQRANHFSEYVFTQAIQRI